MSRFNKQPGKTSFTFPSIGIPIRTDKRLSPFPNGQARVWLLILRSSSSVYGRGSAPKEEGRAEGPGLCSVNYTDKDPLCGRQRRI